MQDYDPFAHLFPLQDVLVAWAVALAVCAVLFVAPEFARNSDAGSADVGIAAAMETTIPRNTDLIAESQPSQ